MVPRKEKVFRQLASAIDARSRCAEKLETNREWFDRWESKIYALVENYLPSGSGVDNGTQIDLKRSTCEKIVLLTAYHHMSEHGMYEGWSEHEVIMTPSLVFDFTVRVTGRDRNEIKEYLGDLYAAALRAEVEVV